MAVIAGGNHTIMHWNDVVWTERGQDAEGSNVYIPSDCPCYWAIFSVLGEYMAELSPATNRCAPV